VLFLCIKKCLFNQTGDEAEEKMTDLSVEYLGIKLKNPLIIGSCGLTNSFKKIEEFAQHQVGAVVLKSIFEEQVLHDNKEILEMGSESWHSELYHYTQRVSHEYGADKNLELIEQVKSKLDIPVIASLNCVQVHWWEEYAKKIERAGADALELNLSFLPRDENKSAEEVEDQLIKTVRQTEDDIKIPIVVKIGPYFTNFSSFAARLDQEKIDGIVLFNRFYQMDIDINDLEYQPANILSSKTEMYNSLRWTGILSYDYHYDISASTGIHDAESVIKFLLAGASTVQLVSTIYQNGTKQIDKILEGICTWMKKHNFDSVRQFQGKLSLEKTGTPEEFERIQYIKGLTGIE